MLLFICLENLFENLRPMGKVMLRDILATIQGKSTEIWVVDNVDDLLTIAGEIW